MARLPVRTLTLNPSIDVASETDKVEPERKVRTCCERIDPGGGGINVARVLDRLGVGVEALFLAGGATGKAFDELLGRSSLARRPIWIADDTRTSLTVHEKSGAEYRFVPEGPTISAKELEACREAIAATPCDYFVASGSLPPGVPDDFYGSVAALAREQGAQFVLDTSGPELKAAVDRGGIALLKVSKEEFDRPAAAGLVASGRVEQVTMTLGSEGALLISGDGTFFLPALATEPVSTVGAGDSFLAGMTYGLVSGLGPAEAFRIAVAAGAAATLSEGTDLAYPDNVWRLLDQVPPPGRID